MSSVRILVALLLRVFSWLWLLLFWLSRLFLLLLLLWLFSLLCRLWLRPELCIQDVLGDDLSVDYDGVSYSIEC